MRRKIEEIITELKEVINNHDLKISDEIIFVEAMTTYRREIVDKSHPPLKKPTRTAPVDNPNDVTPKQAFFLKSNKDAILDVGLKTDGIKTKLEASKVIEAFKKLSEENQDDPYDEESSYL